MVSSLNPQKMDGVSGHVLNLIDSMRMTENTTVTLVCFGEIDASEESGNLRRVKLRKRSCYKFLPIVPLLKLSRIVSFENPDVIHVQGSAFSHMLIYALLMAPRKVSKVLTVHGHPIEEGLVRGWLRMGSVRHRMMIRAERLACERFDAIVTVTKRLREDMDRKFSCGSRTKLSVIPNGVNPRFSGTQFPGCSYLVTESIDANDDFVLLNAKALTATNGQDLLIRAFAEILNVVSNARLLLAGDGPEGYRLRQLASELGVVDRVHFLGMLPNSQILELITVSDIVVIPSRSMNGVEEGSSLLLLEAMASGKPVVASDSGGNAETVVNNETGLLVPENDPSAIADAVLKLHMNPSFAEAIGQRARDFVLRERTWEDVSKEYITVYQSAVSRRITTY